MYNLSLSSFFVFEVYSQKFMSNLNIEMKVDFRVRVQLGLIGEPREKHQ